MRQILKKIGAVGATVPVLGGLLCSNLSVGAAAPTMRWKTLDKAYVSIVIDDNNAELGKLYDLITGEFGFPLCAAVPATSVNSSNIALLRKIEKSGGEILSHTYSHRVLNSSVSDAVIEKEICGSYEALLEKGFNVNGIILAGGGGTEDTSEAFRQKLEPYTARCYKYSDRYGVSTQFNHPRTSLAGNLVGAKNIINQAIQDKVWEPIYAHGLTKDVTTINEGLWRKFLTFLKEQQDAGTLEVVTYRTAYETLASWSVKPDFDPIKSYRTTTTPTTTKTTKTTKTTTTAKTANLTTDTTPSVTTTTAANATSKTSTTATVTQSNSTTTKTEAATTAKDSTTTTVPNSTAAPTTTTTATGTATTAIANAVTSPKPVNVLPYILGGSGAILAIAGGIAAFIRLKKK